MLVITNPSINPFLGFAPGVDGGAPAIQQVLTTLINFTFSLGGIVCFFLLLWGGYEYMTAGGDKEATQKATKRISSALIGLTILFSAFAIIFVIESLFGMSLTKFKIPTIN